MGPNILEWPYATEPFTCKTNHYQEKKVGIRVINIRGGYHKLRDGRPMLACQTCFRTFFNAKMCNSVRAHRECEALPNLSWSVRASCVWPRCTPIFVCRWVDLVRLIRSPDWAVVLFCLLAGSSINPISCIKWLSFSKRVLYYNEQLKCQTYWHAAVYKAIPDMTRP